MESKSNFTKAGFLKSYLLPVIVTFLIPGFGLWFFNHVEHYYDSAIAESLISSVKNDQTLADGKRKEIIDFYERVPISRILASNKPEAREMQANFGDVKMRYAVFRWMKRTGWLCLLTGAGAFLAVGIGVFFSFRSQQAQYLSLRVGWNVLRWFALIQVLGQGALAIALSFWITAFWFESYFVKLILVTAVLALTAVALLIQAIFRKVAPEGEFAGKLLSKESAPALWQRVRHMADKLGTAPPDHIFAGIDANFFVTEHPVKVDDQRYEGRTLFVSLSLLKVLSRSEADAVLAHELAHFSGDDTLYSKRISPLLGQYGNYLIALYQSAISRPVFYFMFFFWNLYQLSLGKLSREREFRADRIGAEMTSPQDAGNALVKITAYCKYRGKIQETLFLKDENVSSMDIFTRIQQGFPEFMITCVNGTELVDSATLHPFDSHPPLEGRLKSLGLDSAVALKSPLSLPALDDSWFSAIDRAQEIEAEQWKSFEDFFHKVHQEKLAWQFKPEGEAETGHVLKFFPELQFTSAKGVIVTLDFQKVRVSDWDAAVKYEEIVSCKVEDHIGGKMLVIEYQPTGAAKTKKQKVKFSNFEKPEPGFLASFEKYYSRHLASKNYRGSKVTAESATD